MQNYVSRILASGGFELRKLLSNDPTLLKNFTINNQNTIGYSIGDIEFVNRNSVTNRLIFFCVPQICDRG